MTVLSADERSVGFWGIEDDVNDAIVKICFFAKAATQIPSGVYG